MFDQTLAQRAAGNLRQVRARRPLIHNITNYVVMNYTANALLACGASPVMAHANEEVEEMVSHAGALVLNLGTLSPDWVEAMVKAGKRANALRIPVILDPVGSGATRLRTESARHLLQELSIRVVRGNASEIMSLMGDDAKTRGVDTLHGVEEATAAAVSLAHDRRTTVVVTGPIDLIADHNRIFQVRNGHPFMGGVTGMGCTATALIGAFLAVDSQAPEAAATALAYFGLAGEKASSLAQGPGTFQVALLDALYGLDESALQAGARIEVQAA